MKVQRFNLNAGSLGGVIQVLRPVPRETREGDTLVVDPWGDLAPIRMVPEFASLIPVVSGEVFSHALHGYLRPLMEVIGPEPEHQLIRIPAPHNRCSLAADCISYDRSRCQPRSSKLPECWAPEGEQAARAAMALVTLAWVEARYVIVVEGPEFVVGRVDQA